MPFPPEETPRKPTEPADAEDTPWIVYPLLCLSLAISPLGAPVIFLLLSWLGYCEGALGSGIDCSMPLGGNTSRSSEDSSSYLSFSSSGSSGASSPSSSSFSPYTA